MEEFKSNSDKSRMASNQPQPVIPTPAKPIGGVQEAEKTKLEKFKESFFVEDLKDVGDYLWSDVMIPTIKQMLATLVTMGANRMLWGDNAPKYPTGNGPSNNYINPMYSYWKGPGPNRQNPNQTNQQGQSPYVTKTISVPNYEFHDYVDENGNLISGMYTADETLKQLRSVCATYGKVSLSKYFEIIQVQYPYTYEDWGWYNLDQASIVSKTRDNEYVYSIKFPQVVALSR